MLKTKKKDKIKTNMIMKKLKKKCRATPSNVKKKMGVGRTCGRIVGYRWTYRVAHWYGGKKRRDRQRVRWKYEITKFLANKNFEREAINRSE